MKSIKSPSSILQVARLYHPTVEGVKKNVLSLAKAAPPFSYAELYKLTFLLFRGAVSIDQAKTQVRSIGFEPKRNAYARALSPTCAYLRSLECAYTLQIDPRSYSISRAMRVPCIPPMVCGTPEGQIVPWLMFWKRNVLDEEQISLFMSMALEVMEQDGELEDAKFLIIDTSEDALDEEGKPKILDCDSIKRLKHEKLQQMLDTFVRGFNAAVAEWPKLQGLEKQPEREVVQNVQPWLFKFGPENS